MMDSEFTALLERDVGSLGETACHVLAEHVPAQGDVSGRVIEAAIAAIDRRLSEQLNLILHHVDFQRMEATWRGLSFLVGGIENSFMQKIKVLDISKQELGRTLRKFRGTAWDQSPIFKKIYEEEYGQFGGEPFGVVIGDYAFDHSPQDVQLLGDMAQIAAAAHAPFIAAAAPSVMQMESWGELANPRDLTRIFQTPEYAAWRSLRESEDARYLGLCMPRFLARLPYGARTDPVEAFDFEEQTDGPDASRHLWTNAAYALAANIARAFEQYGWCVRIRGVDTGGIVEGLPVLSFPTADGAVDVKCSTEIALSERREADLAQAGLIPLVHRKHAGTAAFISAQSLQMPRQYDDPAATASANLSARLPYLFACCRFAHYLKCMVRDKVGSSMDKMQLSKWLQEWLLGYVDGAPDRSSEEWKAAHPLVNARVTLLEKPDSPGHYEARFFLRPHYQLEGLTAVLRIVSRLPAA
ncbi:MAG TPA: type VI secretion system contractile sheath large subunit [Acetobacteraceae bacterium]|nr:type VI secretion system contractile sheath large subunit [Acetobacteraceae bacterium]